LASDILSSSGSWSAASLADLRPENVTDRTVIDLRLAPVEHHCGPADRPPGVWHYDKAVAASVASPRLGSVTGSSTGEQTELSFRFYRNP
jgi:hypothetical protein